ncbi:MAG: globin [Bdellovibrio sp. CG12_big_fil_rev_8_21_14_0_65_39_13]|nr:MAG: globin [Bdellovibrio sp. CG22_combo_CG10-13_8_21_14_all_39_27]PIQ62167.1 MAG: globin [Bdellovibrio sp. CG12_big_fil_rev_8_21_14_0_65_39_13]PIR34179.1 MAG: globin [Bdellovibrio sp. CG11_big_fil_rev_8_21_14_0_20_39_38]
MSSSINNFPAYGQRDTSYQAAGKEQGLRKLSTDFYAFMDTLPEASAIRKMHKEDLALMTDKLTLFLTMWLGGPQKYLEKYGPVNMPQAHRHLIINEAERDAWLLCMDKALNQQDYDESFKDYLKKQFRFPAEMIRKTSRDN